METKKMSLLAILLCMSFAAKAADPGFSILNKSKKPVWVAVRNGSKSLFSSKAMKVNPFTTFSRKTVDSAINISEKTILSVYDKDPGKVTYLTGPAVFPTPLPTHMYSFTVGRTVYVSYDAAKRPELYPQSGTFGKTTKGFPLKNNVSAFNIRETPIDETIKKIYE